MNVRPAFRFLAWGLLLASHASPAAACPGDCDGDNNVVASEVIVGINIALGKARLASCASFDDDGSGEVTVQELVGGVKSAVLGCPRPNRAPEILCTDVYRTYPGLPIVFSIPASDPDGGDLRYTVEELPEGALFDGSKGELFWTPGEDQTGSFLILYTAIDDGDPPLSADGELVFQILPPDPCTQSSCEPATGCTLEIRPIDPPCCAGEPAERIVDPVGSCPNARVLHVGRNIASGFGRLQNCDILRVRNFAQTGAVVDLNVEFRCLNLNNLIEIRLRLETADRLLFDETLNAFPQRFVDGYGRVFRLTLPVLGPGPFFEFEGAEALLTASAEDSLGAIVTHEVRPVLTFERVTEVPDPDFGDPPGTPVGECVEPTATPTPSPTSTATTKAGP